MHELSSPGAEILSSSIGDQSHRSVITNKIVLAYSDTYSYFIPETQKITRSLLLTDSILHSFCTHSAGKAHAFLCIPNSDIMINKVNNCK